jgi:pyruvate, orthophosphate dikinase
VKEGETISIDGGTGNVHKGELPLKHLGITKEFQTIVTWAEKYKSMVVFGEAFNQIDVQKCLDLGADGIGLCRINHMMRSFIVKDSFQKLLLNQSDEETHIASKLVAHFILHEILDLAKPLQKDHSLMISLGDFNLSEIFPNILDDEYDSKIKDLSTALNMNENIIQENVRRLHQLNPSIGCRGSRVLISNPRVADSIIRGIIGNYEILNKIDRCFNVYSE